MIIGLWSLAFLSVSPAHAESLAAALSAAYLNNPTLRAERAGVRASDERVNQALSGWKPTITSTGDLGRVRSDPKPGASNTSDPSGVSVVLSQSIFKGFRTLNSTRQADAIVLAARQQLINVEQTTLQNAVTAFMNVMRDQAIVNLRVKNVKVLKEQLNASNIRFRLGEITRTDVAQARARFSGAVSSLAQARAALATARAAFVRIIGNQPGKLTSKRMTSKILPKNFKTALAIARARHPIILSAIYAENATNHAIKVAKGQLLPEVSVEARYNRRYNPGALDRSDTASIIGRLNVPLYQSGAEYSRIREAKQLNSKQRLLVVEAERQVRAELMSAWEALRAARQSIQSDRAQVEASQMALSGVRQEAKVGTRTTLDVLDAEQEALDAHIALAASLRNEVVTEYRLLAAMGRLTARALKLPVKRYDPIAHHKRVRGKWIGFGRR